MIEVRDLVRDATAASLTERQCGALAGLLDEIILGVDTVGRVQRDYPAGRAAAEAECWRWVEGRLTELVAWTVSGER